MKKYLLVFILLFSLSFLFISCGKKQEDNTKVIKQPLETTKQTETKQQKQNDNTLTINEKNIKGQTFNEKEILKQQKEQLPKMLELLKEQNVCLTKANSKQQALECGEEMKNKAKEMNLSDVNISDEREKEYKEKLKWDKEEKEKTLKELNIAIESMSNIVPCVEKANSMQDLGKCFEEDSDIEGE